MFTLLLDRDTWNRSRSPLVRPKLCDQPSPYTRSECLGVASHALREECYDVAPWITARLLNASGAAGVPQGAFTAPLPPPPPMPAALENHAPPGPPPIPSGDMSGAPAPAPPPIPSPEDTDMEMDVVRLRHHLCLSTAYVSLVCGRPEHHLKGSNQAPLHKRAHWMLVSLMQEPVGGLPPPPPPPPSQEQQTTVPAQQGELGQPLGSISIMLPVMRGCVLRGPLI